MSKNEKSLSAQPHADGKSGDVTSRKPMPESKGLITKLSLIEISESSIVGGIIGEKGLTQLACLNCQVQSRRKA